MVAKSSSQKGSSSPAAAITVHLKSASGRLIESLAVSGDDTVEELKHIVAASKAQLSIHRIRLSLKEDVGTKGGAPPATTLLAEEGKTLAHYKVGNNATIILKDLGPQISWRTVFVIEYLGPILIHVAFFLYHHRSMLDRIKDGQASAATPLAQLVAFVAVLFHFGKREYETLLVHRFSHATMPFGNLFKNCGHYWLLSGVLIAHNLYSPSYRAPPLPIVWAALAVFIAAEVANFYTHTILRDLRPKNSTRRAIPKGFGFSHVSCPNYLFEIIAWAAFSAMTGLASSWIFTAVASVQMYVWAVKKHQRYRKEFSTYPKSRKALIPFLL